MHNNPSKGPWRKSTFCNGADACVEVAYTSACGGAGDCVQVGVCECDGRTLVLVRDSKLGEKSPVLRFAADDWREFTAALAAEQLGTYSGPILLVLASLNRWEMWREGAPWCSLVFDDAEVDAFVAGVVAGEFSPEALSRSDEEGRSEPQKPPQASQEPSPVSV